MQAAKINKRNTPNRTLRSQRGVVLLIALIILVAMTLAGIGMMRSVDTGNMIAGNMAFRDSTMNVSDVGTSAAFNALMAVNNVADPNYSVNKTILNFNSGQLCPAGTSGTGAAAVGCPGGNINFPGYMSTPFNLCEVTGQTTGTINGSDCTTWQVNSVTPNNQPWWTVAANWNNAATMSIPDPNSPNAPPLKVQYWIHRMCQKANTDPSSTLTGGQLCQIYTTPTTNNSHQAGGQQLAPAAYVYYRVTVRTTGPRNTVSVVQAMVQQQP